MHFELYLIFRTFLSSQGRCHEKWFMWARMCVRTYVSAIQVDAQLLYWSSFKCKQPLIILLRYVGVLIHRWESARGSRHSHVCQFSQSASLPSKASLIQAICGTHGLQGRLYKCQPRWDAKKSPRERFVALAGTYQSRRRTKNESLDITTS